MQHRTGSAVLWCAVGLILGAARFAGGEGDDDLRAKLIEVERLSAQLRALDAGRAAFPPVDEDGRELDCLHVLDLTLGVTEFYRARPWNSEAPMYSGPVEEAPQPFGTIEELAYLLQTSVRPEAWEEGAHMTPCGPLILVRARPDVNRAVRAFLDEELRPRAHCTVQLRLEVVEADDPPAGALAAAAGGALEPALRARLDEAIGSGGARLVFAGCVRALSGQQVALWHGAQVATVPDADVEVKTRADAADPVVDVELLGTNAEVRSTVGGDPARVRVQIDLADTALDLPVRTVETRKAGTLQMPARTTTGFEADLWTAPDRWAVAGERAGPDGKRRFLLVRPTVIGGAR